MRVAVVAERTARHEDADGATRLSDLATALADRGHEVTVFCNQWWEGDTQAPTLEVGSVAYRAVTYADRSVPGRFGRRLPRLIRRVDPDVIHARHEPPLGVLGASVAGTLTRTPLVVDWYDHEPREGWHERLRRRAARTPARVVTPSNLVKTGVMTLGRPEAETAVIPSCIDLDAIRATDAEAVGDVVYARRLDADANLENLLLALAELRTVDWSAVVIGDGPARDRYESQAADLRIEDRVSFLGEQPLERRHAIYKGAHAAVHTATVAPFAREFLRALACGCVGIAEYHEHSSAHELIEHRERGMRVTGESGLADAIERAAELPQKTLDEDFASFDESEILERYLACYREMQAEQGVL